VSNRGDCDDEVIEPYYPKPGNSRPPIGVERMLRIYFLQHWFNLADPAVEEPDETTVCRFRRML
jgi:IS5 family transposase